MPASETAPTVILLLLLCGGPGGNAGTGDALLTTPWGTGFEQMRDRFELVPLNSDSMCTRYTSNITSVEGITVAECILEFRGTAFTGAAVFTRGSTSTHAFLALFVRLFGAGKKENARAYQWFTPTTHAFYDEDSDGDGYMYWYARNLSAGPPPERDTIRRNLPDKSDHR